MRIICCVENCLNMYNRRDLSDPYNRYNLEPRDMRSSILDIDFDIILYRRII